MLLSKLMPLRLARSCGRDTSGAAAIEFALIAPVAMIMLLGAVEYSRAVLMSRRFNLLTATMSDLIARDSSENPSTIAGLQKAVTTMWAPYDPTTLKVQVMVVRQGGAAGTKANTNYVDWAQPLTTGASVPASCSNYAGLPNGMLNAGGSAVIVTASYTYTTLFGSKILYKVPGMSATTQAWTSTSTHSPRDLCNFWEPTEANCAAVPCES